jgi:isoamylase
MSTKICPGTPYPLGASWDGKGVNFAIYSPNAYSVDLCLFDAPTGSLERDRIRLIEKSHQIYHGYIPGLKPRQLYGYRVDGPYDPERGHRFNVNKLLIDPYAKAIASTVEWDDALYGYHITSGDDRQFSEKNSAPYAPKSVVIDPYFDWGEDHRPGKPYHKTIIYEAHVKGFTKQNPEIPEDIRGTYQGIAHPASIKHLKSLGITAIELMPVHHFISDRHLQEKGLSNYWGYNTIGFFAPDIRYSSPVRPGDQVTEFKAMVKELHKNGIEVILDVVYNHTGEGNHLGPTLSFKGIDNEGYYRLTKDKRYYNDYTGTGNTLYTRMPHVLRMIMDSLRYWILEMHVDGFRFDLASTLARELHAVERLSSFFDIIYQDPVISQVKLIAEPWDIGEDGYQVGKFPAAWGEWNGRYRDCIRDYWRGADSMLAEFAERFTGSSDLYKEDNRTPAASINIITAHDGFTLRDLVTYNEKHNDANGDQNTDGESNNKSWNYGVEGETDNKEINQVRKQQIRNFLATLFLSQGVPMLVAGDEMGKTQKGNNNAYCQDNEISWLDWIHADQELIDFTSRMIKLRNEHPVFSRRKWFKGQPSEDSGLKDIAWFLPEGHQMTENHWSQDFAKSLGVFLNGQAMRTLNENGEPVLDDSFYVMFNAFHEKLPFKLPADDYGTKWTKILDTSDPNLCQEEFTAESVIEINGRSIVVLQCMTQTGSIPVKRKKQSGITLKESTVLA